MPIYDEIGVVVQEKEIGVVVQKKEIGVVVLKKTGKINGRTVGRTDKKISLEAFSSRKQKH